MRVGFEVWDGGAEGGAYAGEWRCARRSREKPPSSRVSSISLKRPGTVQAPRHDTTFGCATLHTTKKERREEKETNQKKKKNTRVR